LVGEVKEKPEGSAMQALPLQVKSNCKLVVPNPASSEPNFSNLLQI